MLLFFISPLLFSASNIPSVPSRFILGIKKATKNHKMGHFSDIYTDILRYALSKFLAIRDPIVQTKTASPLPFHFSPQACTSATSVSTYS